MSSATAEQSGPGPKLYGLKTTLSSYRCELLPQLGESIGPVAERITLASDPTTVGPLTQTIFEEQIEEQLGNKTPQNTI